MSPIRGFDPNAQTSSFGDFIGRDIVRMENGQSEVRFTMSEVWLNMQGILHGGAYAAMLDTACGVAARSMLDMDKYRGQVTLELKTSYLKAGGPGAYCAKGRVLRMGRSVSYVEASLYNDADEEVARASTTFKLLSRD